MIHHYVKLSEGKLYVSYSFLRSQGVTDKKLSSWSSRKSCNKVYFDNRPFIEYSTIPTPTLTKLPPERELVSKIKEGEYDKYKEGFTSQLECAYTKTFTKYLDEYKQDKRLTIEQVTSCAKVRSVWEKVLELSNGNKGNTELLWKAFDAVIKGKYSNYHVFCSTKSKAVKDINSIVIDSRWFRKQPLAFEEQVYDWAKGLLSDPVNHTAKNIWRKLTKLCIDASIKAPKYTWVKNFVRENERNHEIFASKYGKKVAFDKVEPYAKLTFDFAGSQWQIDGWDLPFYMQGFYKLVLFVVRDAHSAKIVGYSVGKSEDTELILNGIEDAVRNTGYLPAEILSDNHSFNKTNEAKNFKLALDSLGLTWTVTENPRYKSIAERYLRTLGEIFCKDYPGYIGQGIKTREKAGRPSQEYRDKYTKANTWLSESEIKAIAAKVVQDFNNELLSKFGKSPNELHTQSQKPHIIKVDIFDRLRLFTRKTELTVKRGQINLTRGGTTYEYQLSAEQFSQLNDKKVIVRYEDFSMIYLYDSKERAICSVKQKVAIHGAKSEQTEKDIDLLNKHKGRLTGIKAKAKKSIESLRERMSPEAFEALNRITTPKDIMKEVEQDYNLKQRVEELGVDLNLVEVKKLESNLPPAFQPKEKKPKSPFSVRGQHKIDVIDLTKEEEDY